MEIQIKSNNIQLTESLRNYIEERINSCERFIKKINFPLRAEVEVEKITKHHRKGDIFRAEINLPLPGKLIHCESRKDDIYLAITDLKDKLQRELKEYKAR
ncbi:MAG TPA: ribosome-associated translation inhibitor RaiA [Candidatus Pacearchaeota archaeon]|nr:ribosome-associated translation inhibitor RaiA [Candidatus Pacearchaeota archaeon]HOK94283.1 ribosome-associated translation inhibitor RaiA [Candidatus Pacearchaeota archaeon]HPO75440.1 ribosome-associated translation inhibitor RaiA [Candidatus Pacearchaeota archaeon]